MKISIAIPIYNEEHILDELCKRLTLALKKDFRNWKYEIILVDDGSTDKSYSILIKLHKKYKNLKVIQFSRNFGHHIALSAALDHANGDFVVMMDGDLQDRPEEIKKLYKKLLGGYDVVYAKRKNKNHNFFKKINSYLFNILINFLINEKIVINSTIFRIMTRQVVQNIKLLHEKNRYLIGLIGWVGFKTTSQEVIHDKRYAGKTKYTLTKQYDLALNAIFSFTNYPLRIGIKIGVGVILLSFIFSIFALTRKFIYGTALEGWTSILIAILALGGFQILLIGVIGEYVGRTYVETKQRPLYIIKKILK